jgi:hypothetical protein
VADGRRNNGGHSTKGFAGRKPKSDEQALIEKLSPLEDEAHKKLKEAVKSGEQWAIRLFFEYMYGKPKQSMAIDGINTNVTINFIDGSQS